MRGAGKLLATLALAHALAAAAPAATITILNNDAPGEGFNDPTVVAAVPGNPATTLGGQRLNVFQAAAATWGAALRSSVTIQVVAQFNPLTCTPSSAVLGSAGPLTAHRDFANAPVAATWYVQATANSRANTDLDGATPDISAQFNSTLDLGGAGCLGGLVWWYGIDAPPVAGTIDLYTTVLHEIAHGLGVLSLHNLNTGAKFMGFDDAYLRRLRDETLALAWPALSDAQRLTSQVNTGNLTWTGPNASSRIPGFNAGTTNGRLRMYAPNPVQPGSSVSHWDTALSPNELMEPILTATSRDYATYMMLADVGWRMHLIFKDGFQSSDDDFWSTAVP